MTQILYIIDTFININFLLITILLFLLKKGNIRANKVLSIILVLIIIQNVFYAFYVEKKIFYFLPHLIRVHIPFLFAIAPTFYFYFKLLFNKEYRFTIKHLFHYLPSFLIILILLPFYCQLGNDKITWLQQGKFEYHYILGAFFYLQFLIYVAIIIYQLRKYSENIKDIDYYSEEMKQWMKELIIILIAFLVFTIIPVFISFKIESLLYIPILNSFIYFYIIYKVFFRPEIFFNLQTIQNAIADKKKNKNTILTNSEIEILHQNLMNYFEQTKIYLQNDISLPLIAEKLNISYHILSHIINKKNNQNFNDFINRKRIEEAKKRLCDFKFDNLTIEAIGKSVGFNSKISFYDAFKKYVGITPSQYKKSKSKLSKHL